MRIFHIIAGGEYGGAETFFVDLVQALSRRGLEQHAFTRPFDLRLKQLEGAGCSVTAAGMGGPLDFLSPVKLNRALKETRPDVTLSWMSRAARLARSGPWINIGRLGGYYNLKYYKQCDHLVCNTPNIVSHCVDNGWDKDRVSFIPNFSPLVVCDPLDRKTLETPEDAPVLLILARLEESKGVDLALRALADIANAYLWIAGTGSQLTALGKMANELDVQDRVRFLGWRTDRDALLQAADICLVPSRQEPFGNVILNAWENMTPVVASKSQGPSFLIEQDVNGLLFPVDDADALTEAIRRLVQDSGLAERLTANGKEQVNGPYSLETVVDAYCRLFERVQKSQS